MDKKTIEEIAGELKEIREEQYLRYKETKFTRAVAKFDHYMEKYFAKPIYYCINVALHYGEKIGAVKYEGKNKKSIEDKITPISKGKEIKQNKESRTEGEKNANCDN